MLQGGGGGVSVQQGGGQGSAQLPHHRGRRGALPDNVADDDRDPTLLQVQHVIPVATSGDVLHARKVAGGQRQTVELGKLLGEQAALQGLSDLMLGLVEPGPLQRLATLPSQGKDHRSLLGREHRRRVSEAQPERADRGVIDDQR
jgi:hypothetical protein